MIQPGAFGVGAHPWKLARHLSATLISRMRKHFHRVIAIDGPAASGKSSVARELAGRLGFVYVNSGAIYRAITWQTASP